LLSTGGLDERGVRWNLSNSLLSRALIRLRRAGLRDMMRTAELKVRILFLPPAESQERTTERPKPIHLPSRVEPTLPLAPVQFVEP
jgi:hypothetical protein